MWNVIILKYLFHSSEKETLHFLQVIILTVSETWWAVSLVAINAVIAILVASDDVLASEALAGNILLNLSDHALVVLPPLFLCFSTH